MAEARAAELDHAVGDRDSSRAERKEIRRWQRFPKAIETLFEKKAFAHLATVGADGAPQVTPVWVDYDGTHVRFNTARGRVKDKNLERNPAVALSIQDPDNPYRYLQVRGSGRRDDREGRRRAHRLARQEVPRAGQVPLPQARRGAGHLKVTPERVQRWGRSAR